MKRKGVSLAPSLEHRLSSYALAASAAGVGVLAVVQPAEAKIVYTPAHVVIGKDTNITRYIDLNHDGIHDFELKHLFSSSSNHAFSALWVLGSNGSNRAMGKTYKGAFALRAGAKIGSYGGFSRNHTLMAVAGSPSGALSGYWANYGRGVKNHYLGLRFLIEGKIHYGWARLNVTIQGQGQGYSIAGLLTGYAYETVPNKAIIAGKTHGPDVVTVQDPSLGHLARGASAIPAWRRTQH